MIFRNILLFSLSLFLMGSSPTYIPPIVDEAFNKSSPKQTLKWNLTPTVIICDHAPISKKEIDSALDWWRNIGYIFYGPYMGGLYNKKCLDDSPVGYILVTLVSGIDYNHNSLATTKIYSNTNTNEILWSIIELKQGLVKERVLEHEFGHSIGWMHTSIKGSMMNRTLPNGGWSSDGLVRE